MAYSEVETLVFPDSMCLGEGLYVELFLLVLLISCRDGKEKEPFWLKPLGTFKANVYFCAEK